MLASSGAKVQNRVYPGDLVTQETVRLVLYAGDSRIIRASWHVCIWSVSQGFCAECMTPKF